MGDEEVKDREVQVAISEYDGRCACYYGGAPDWVDLTVYIDPLLDTARTIYFFLVGYWGCGPIRITNDPRGGTSDNPMDGCPYSRSRTLDQPAGPNEPFGVAVLEEDGVYNLQQGDRLGDCTAAKLLVKLGLARRAIAWRNRDVIEYSSDKWKDRIYEAADEATYDVYEQPSKEDGIVRLAPYDQRPLWVCRASLKKAQAKLASLQVALKAERAEGKVPPGYSWYEDAVERARKEVAEERAELAACTS